MYGVDGCHDAPRAFSIQCILKKNIFKRNNLFSFKIKKTRG